MPSRTDPMELMATCIELLRPAAEAKGLTLSLVLAPETPLHVSTDPVRLRQIVVNLLRNAVKFTKLGNIELHLYPVLDRAVLRIEVADTGSGIPASQRHLLYQLFDRLDTHPAETTEGAALGLARSEQLAAMIGGSLGHHDNPAGGSVFWLELPLHAPFASPATLSPQLDPLRVLVVDDNAMNRDIAGSFLRAAGHEVVRVGSGAEAVAAVTTANFDVVLMDVRMPEMDGLEATRRIRRLEDANGHIPIIAVTAQSFTEQVIECHKAGMDGHVRKPFDPETLIASVVRAATPDWIKDGNFGPVHVVVPTLAASATPVIGSDLAICDTHAFERTAGFLDSRAVDCYLQEIAARAEALLPIMHQPDALARTELVESTHALVGTAGMLGFERLTTVGRQFAWATETGASNATVLAEGLSAAITATLPALRRAMTNY